MASELLLRGFRPLIAAVDDGIDITLTTGPTLQIKTCRTPSETVRQSGRRYFVFTMHAFRERGNGGKRIRRHHMVADFAIFWCVDHDFYIVPKERVGDRHTVNIAVFPVRTSQWEPYRGRWDLLEVDTSR